MKVLLVLHALHLLRKQTSCAMADVNTNVIEPDLKTQSHASVSSFGGKLLNVFVVLEYSQRRLYIQVGV